MSTRSRDAALLAQALTQHTAVPVMVTYHGHAQGRAGGWHVEWCDGPTDTTMRELVTKLGLAHSIRCPIRAYDRASTDLAEACALLARVASAPELATRVGTVLAADAYRTASYPEAADAQTRRRAEALLSLSPHRTLELDVLDRLREHATTTGGWVGVLAWLDGIAAAAQDLDVVDLTIVRRRREQTR